MTPFDEPVRRLSPDTFGDMWKEGELCADAVPGLASFFVKKQ